MVPLRSNVLKLRKRIVLIISSAGNEHHRAAPAAPSMVCRPQRIREDRAAGTPAAADWACRRSSACPAWRSDVEARQAHAAAETKGSRPPSQGGRAAAAPTRTRGSPAPCRTRSCRRANRTRRRTRSCAGQPRDSPVEHVEHDREADERRRRRELAAHGVDDAGVAAEHVRHREHARTRYTPRRNRRV